MTRAQRRARIYDLARVEPDRARELVDRISKSNSERRELESSRSCNSLLPRGAGAVVSAIRLTRRALLCLEAVGLDIGETVRRDMRALRDGRVSAKELLAHCLQGADAERGWRG